MIRKNATSLILIAMLVLAMFVSLPVAHAASHGSTNVAAHSDVTLSDDALTPTPTPAPGGQTDSGVSGGGNGGG